MTAKEEDVCETRYVDRDRVEAVLCALASRRQAVDVSQIFKVLSDPTRVSIIHALSLADLCNCDLASVLGISESAVSHQMRDLKLMKLVTAEKRGRMVYYRLSDTHVRHVLEDSLRHVQENGDVA
jgi:DNA-binding transcriptional ArsR family regulator